MTVLSGRSVGTPQYRPGDHLLSSHTNGGYRYGEPTRQTCPKHDTEPIWTAGYCDSMWSGCRELRFVPWDRFLMRASTSVGSASSRAVLEERTWRRRFKALPSSSRVLFESRSLSQATTPPLATRTSGPSSALINQYNLCPEIRNDLGSECHRATTDDRRHP